MSLRHLHLHAAHVSTHVFFTDNDFSFKCTGRITDHVVDNPREEKTGFDIVPSIELAIYSRI